MTADRLKDATSPYLQQHANNPVDWWPWCEEALDLARRENKPVLLSIGYSACHWCHVMAHESFEDPATAAVMNELYVNIKVDREERPDLDRIYQTAHQLLSRRAGGWPLTVFLTPDDQIPFFAGTYFPPQARHGLPAFRDLLRQIEQAFREQRDAIDQQNNSLVDALLKVDTPAASDDIPNERVFSQSVDELGQQFDAKDGGFGGAPKFPHPSTLRFLLRQGTRHDDTAAVHMARFTLEKMAEGGIQDHLAGGFCRYSVDGQWMIPHFEKMLYDNGQLLALYAEAWRATGQRALFRHVCERTAAWLMTEMQSPTGGYFASLDADSEGEEGRFYVWTREEVAALLDEPEYAVFAPRFGLDREANFEGHWHLHTYTATEQLVALTGKDARTVRGLLLSARNKLLEARADRVRPGCDEKILTSWNALAITGMARAARVFGRDDWLTSAEQALAYILSRHIQNGRLLATSRDGEARLAAYLDDHAYLIQALLEVLQARWHDRYLAVALDLADQLLAHFEDQQHGGFYFTADDHERLIHRPRPLADDAMPSGNSVAIEVLQTLAALTGDAALQAAADRAVNAAWPSINRASYAHLGLLEGVQGYLDPGELIIIRGEPEQTAAWRTALQSNYVAGRRVFVIPPEATELPPGLAEKRPQPDAVVAYRCRGHRCDPAITDPARLTATLA